MAKTKTKYKVLLIEPNYSNKYPPVGLMKIASYYRNLGNWEVFFYKGDLTLFVIERLADKMITELNDADSSGNNWQYHKDVLMEYIRTRKSQLLEDLPLADSDVKILLQNIINNYKDQYCKKTWQREWDRVGVTTLFTFYWDITIKTIEFARDYLVKDTKNLMVGGVLASIQPNELSKATQLPIHKHGEAGGIHIGILRPGDLDSKDTQPIDELELDYSILDEIEYQYPMSNAYYRYTTRGCVNRCKFCAVPTLEPEYQDYIPLKKRIDIIKDKYGEQKDLLLMDNNVLASTKYAHIIQEIKDCGFEKGAKFIQPNFFDIAIRNLNNGINDRAYIRKSWHLINELYKTLKGEESFAMYQLLEKYHLFKFYTTTKENLIASYEEIKPIYTKHHLPGKGKLRFIDFNQGMDARLFTPEKAKLLSQIAIRPVRIAFDDIKTEKKYRDAISMCVRAGIKDFSNYLLYNFNDKPEDLYQRLRINVDLCEELNVSIYSFPMKFHPIRKTDDMGDIDFSHNRDYIGQHWNRKYIRAIQAILNSTKGKIGKGTDFFEKAFGKTVDDFMKILVMPETMIIYRFLFEWFDTEKGKSAAISVLKSDAICNISTNSWWKCYCDTQKFVSAEEWQKVDGIIKSNNFDIDESSLSAQSIKLLKFYINNRKNVMEPDSDLWIMRQEYYKNPTIAPKRHSLRQISEKS